MSLLLITIFCISTLFLSFRFEKFITYYFPIFILISIYLIGNIRSDYLILISIFFAMILKKIYQNKKVVLNNISYGFIFFLTFITISTIIFSLFNHENSNITFQSFSMNIYWIKILLISLIAVNTTYDEELFVKTIKIIYLFGIIILFHGLLEALNINFEFLRKLTFYFIPPSNYFMYEALKNLSVFRATSIMGHPTVFAYLVCFLFAITFYHPRSIVNWLPRKILLIFIMTAGFASLSKIFLVFIFLFLFYNFIFERKKYFYTFILLLIILFIFYYKYFHGQSHSVNIIHSLNWMLTSVVDRGFIEFFFRTRFDSELGLLRPSFQIIQNNFLIGVGANIIPNIFYGDSFYISQLMKVGLLGTTYFIFFIIFIRENLKRIDYNISNLIIQSLNRTLIFLIMFNLLIGIGVQSFTLTKISEIIYFYIFMIIVHFKKKEQRNNVL